MSADDVVSIAKYRATGIEQRIAAGLVADNGEASLLRDLVAEIARLTEERQWQPIETAPKDGTHVLMWMGGIWQYAVLVSWMSYQDGDEPGWFGGGSYWKDVATHWMPLPDPPEGQPEGGER